MTFTLKSDTIYIDKERKICFMENQEFNKRCCEVFEDEGSIHFHSIKIENDNIKIAMSEIDENGNIMDFDYCPDMSDRPQALDYLLGKRNNFND